MTSNPSIFENAIVESHDYDEDIQALALQGKDAEAIYEAISQRDVEGARRPVGVVRQVGIDLQTDISIFAVSPVVERPELSTGAKDPDYSDVKYVEALIGPDTVNTTPVKTPNAYRDHGEPKARLEQDVNQARWVLERLPELGIGIDHVTRQLEDEGVEKFNQPFDKLIAALAQRSPRQLAREV
jgi:transaldolase